MVTMFPIQSLPDLNKAMVELYEEAEQKVIRGKFHSVRSIAIGEVLLFWELIFSVTLHYFPPLYFNVFYLALMVLECYSWSQL